MTGQNSKSQIKTSQNTQIPILTNHQAVILTRRQISQPQSLTKSQNCRNNPSLMKKQNSQTPILTNTSYLTKSQNPRILTKSRNSDNHTVMDGQGIPVTDDKVGRWLNHPKFNQD